MQKNNNINPVPRQMPHSSTTLPITGHPDCFLPCPWKDEADPCQVHERHTVSQANACHSLVQQWHLDGSHSDVWQPYGTVLVWCDWKPPDLPSPSPKPQNTLILDGQSLYGQVGTSCSQTNRHSILPHTKHTHTIKWQSQKQASGSKYARIIR